jgi:hypothetical protein
VALKKGTEMHHLIKYKKRNGFVTEHARLQRVPNFVTEQYFVRSKYIICRIIVHALFICSDAGVVGPYGRSVVPFNDAQLIVLQYYRSLGRIYTF